MAAAGAEAAEMPSLAAVPHPSGLDAVHLAAVNRIFHHQGQHCVSAIRAATTQLCIMEARVFLSWDNSLESLRKLPIESDAWKPATDCDDEIQAIASKQFADKALGVLRALAPDAAASA